MRSMTDEHPINHLPLPEYNPDRSMGQGFNIVKMIEEHAPLRIQAIEDELSMMHKKMVELSSEQEILTELLNVIGNAETMNNARVVDAD